jgi:hypothetical protein
VNLDERRRPEGDAPIEDKRLGGGDIVFSLEVGRPMKADFGQLNWTGRTWRLEHNNKKLPSMKQIRDGLVQESKV